MKETNKTSLGKLIEERKGNFYQEFNIQTNDEWLDNCDEMDDEESCPCPQPHLLRDYQEQTNIEIIQKIIEMVDVDVAKNREMMREFHYSGVDKQTGAIDALLSFKEELTKTLKEIV
ncbi:hypothetical protein HN747_03145 [archaeon]|jgi:hypothetical protein|nr:hypothetical protein [archaeon]